MMKCQTSVQSAVKSYWNQRAEIYDKNQHRSEREDTDKAAWTRVAASVLPPVPSRVLDAGTGTGYFAFIMANLGYEVLGCDISEAMINLAKTASKERTKRDCYSPQFFLADASRPNLKTASVNAVTARYLMWTLPDPLGALLSWKRILVPGGTLAIIDAPWFPAGLQANSTPGFAEAYSPTVAEALPLSESRTIDDTVALVRQAGFQHVNVTPLDEIYHLDQVTGPAPGHHVQLQYLITGKVPEYISLGFGDHRKTAQTAVDLIEPRLDQWINVLTMAADPTRLRVLIALHAAPEATVTELARALTKSPNTITQALVRLEKADLTTSRADGRFRRWRITDERLHDLLHHVSAPHSDLHPDH